MVSVVPVNVTPTASLPALPVSVSTPALTSMAVTWASAGGAPPQAEPDDRGHEGRPLRPTAHVPPRRSPEPRWDGRRTANGSQRFGRHPRARRCAPPAVAVVQMSSSTLGETRSAGSDVPRSTPEPPSSSSPPPPRASSRSLPELPCSRSDPAPPLRLSGPSSPCSSSDPPPPTITSVPSPPQRAFGPALPVMRSGPLPPNRSSMSRPRLSRSPALPSLARPSRLSVRGAWPK